MTLGQHLCHSTWLNSAEQVAVPADPLQCMNLTQPCLRPGRSSLASLHQAPSSSHALQTATDTGIPSSRSSTPQLTYGRFGPRLLSDLRCSSTMAGSVAAALLTKCSRLGHRIRAAATPFQLAPGPCCCRSCLASICPAPPSAGKRRFLQLCSRLRDSDSSCAVLGRGAVHSIAEGC